MPVCVTKENQTRKRHSNHRSAQMDHTVTRQLILPISASAAGEFVPHTSAVPCLSCIEGRSSAGRLLTPGSEDRKAVNLWPVGKANCLVVSPTDPPAVLMKPYTCTPSSCGSNPQQQHHQQQHQLQHQQQQQQHQMHLEVLRKRQYRVGLNVFNKGPPEVTTFSVSISFPPFLFGPEYDRSHLIVPVLHASSITCFSHSQKKDHVVCVYAC